MNNEQQKTGLLIVDKDAPKGLRDVQYSEITDIPLAEYLQKAGWLYNTSNGVLYDTACYSADIEINEGHTAELFTKGVGESDVIPNSGYGIESKSKVLTNMDSDGKVGGDKTFIPERVSVDILLNSSNTVEIPELVWIEIQGT